MSYTHDLVCMKCREVLPLGKLANISEEGSPIPWEFTGWRDQSTGELVEKSDLMELVERFLLLHRGHELVVLPEKVILTYVDPEGTRLAYVERRVELFDRRVDEPSEDVDVIPFDIVERLIGEGEERD